MKDLTQGPIPRHVIAMTLPMAAGMLLQTVYFFVDLYFVSKLGDAAIAGVGAAGNLMFLVFAMTQALGVGTVAMVSHAVGRKDRAGANLIFNQAVAMALLGAAVTLVGGFALITPYTRFFLADAASAQAAAIFLHWFIPGLALQFAIVVMSSGLRGTGIVKPAMAVQGLTVVMNAILAPVLIAGWGTGHPLGVAGGGLATTISIAVGVIVLVIYFLRLEHYVAFDRRQWKPRFRTWGKMLNIGLPAGAEFAFIGIFAAVLYWATRHFGPEAQAGYGVGARINQMIAVPAMALAFSAAPIAGQNFGARKAARVRETFRVTATYSCIVMLLLTGLVQWKAEAMAHIFTNEPATVAVAVEFLHYISWNFVAAGIVWTCSSMFQAMGNTWPSFFCSASRIFLFAFPVIWMAQQPWFQLWQVFVLSVATVLMQATAAYIWLQAQFRERLAAPHASAGAGAAVGAE